MTKQELKDKRNHKLECAKDIMATIERSGALMTDDQEKAIEGYKQEAAEFDAKIAKIEKQETLFSSIDNTRSSLAKPEARKSAPMEISNDRIEVRDNPIYSRSGKLKCFRNDAEGERNAWLSGNWLLARFTDNEKSKRICQENGIDYRAAMGEGSISVGGALVPTPLSNAILVFRENYGVVRQNVRITPMTENTLLLPKRLTSLTATFTSADNTEYTESEPTFAQATLVANELNALALVSKQVSNDAVISVADYLAQDMAYAFALKEDSDILATGDGTAACNNFTSIASTIVDGSHNGSKVVAAAAATTFATTTLTDLYSLMAACPTYSRPNAKWFLSQQAKDLIMGRLASSANGNNVMTFGNGVADRFLGYEIVTSQVLPTAPTSQAGVAYVLFGDLNKTIAFGERAGMAIDTSTHRYFEKGQIAFLGTERVAYTYINAGSNSVPSGVVGLVGHA